MGEVSQSLYKKETSNADRRHLSEAFDFYFSFSKMIDMRVGKKKERLVGECGVASRCCWRGEGRLLYIRLDAPKEKKQQKNARGNAKKKKEKTTSRERDIHTLTLSAFSFRFSNITSTRKHTRARLPLPPKPKPKKQVTSPLSTRI